MPHITESLPEIVYHFYVIMHSALYIVGALEMLYFITYDLQITNNERKLVLEKIK